MEGRHAAGAGRRPATGREPQGGRVVVGGYTDQPDSTP